MKTHLTKILREMCRRVKIPMREVHFNTKAWYWFKSWTQEEQDSFRDWMADYLYKNKEARQEIMKNAWKDKKRCVKTADEFVFNYGWRLKEDNDA